MLPMPMRYQCKNATKHEKAPHRAVNLQRKGSEVQCMRNETEEQSGNAAAAGCRERSKPRGVATADTESKNGNEAKATVRRMQAAPSNDRAPEDAVQSEGSSHCAVCFRRTFAKSANRG